MLPPKKTIYLFFKKEPVRFYLRHTYKTHQNLTFVESFRSKYIDKTGSSFKTIIYTRDLTIYKERNILLFVKEKELILCIEEGENDILVHLSRINTNNKREHSILSFTNIAENENETIQF
ncbi:MAG: hypothetical protein VZS44_08565 [Bacilli bacterium]|nr:hypothetical protein [Bacilli bacterium]